MGLIYKVTMKVLWLLCAVMCIVGVFAGVSVGALAMEPLSHFFQGDELNRAAGIISIVFGPSVAIACCLIPSVFTLSIQKIAENDKKAKEKVEAILKEYLSKDQQQQNTNK